jgi:GNAT superfamily N-acetyltransferase
MLPSSIELIVVDYPDRADHEAILKRLIAFNENRAGSWGFKEMAILLRNSSGETIGGLWGMLFYDWFYIELLFVPQNARGFGLGTRLLKKAEDIARAHNCIGIWLDTYSFQSPGFYERSGYQVFGTLNDYPRGKRRFFAFFIIQFYLFYLDW